MVLDFEWSLDAHADRGERKGDRRRVLRWLESVNDVSESGVHHLAQFIAPSRGVRECPRAQRCEEFPGSIDPPISPGPAEHGVYVLGSEDVGAEWYRDHPHQS